MVDAAKECPQCHLLNPPNALRCECGNEFALPTKQQEAKGRPFRPQPRGHLFRPKAGRGAAKFAVFQAGVGLIFAIVSAVDGTLLDLNSEVNILIVFPAACAVVLAVALFRKHSWAAYALVGVSLGSFIARLTVTSSPWVIPCIVYICGAINLARSTHFAPSLRELSWRSILLFWAVVSAGPFIIIFAFDLALGIGVEFSILPGSIMWITLAIIFLLQALALSLAARRASAWPFETVLVITLLSGLTTALLDVALGGAELTPPVLPFYMGLAITAGLVGFALAGLLPEESRAWGRLPTAVSPQPDHSSPEGRAS